MRVETVGVALVLAFSTLFSGCAHPARRAEAPAPAYPDERAWSQYVEMRDGTRLAVDVYLPDGLGPGLRVPAILHMTRYYRSLDIRALWKPFYGFGPYAWTERGLRDDLIDAGYAWVDADVRGSGASFGSRERPLSAAEVEDGAELVDWLVAQPWSSGRVGATGLSYDGTAAETLLVNKHPAVRAVVPRYSGWDVYEDVFFPGGLRNESLFDVWSRLTDALDRNRLGEVFGFAARLVLRGVRPVDKRLLDAAVAEHADNVDVLELVAGAEHRDDLDATGAPAFATGPRHGRHAIVESRAAVLGYTGWFDGPYVRGAVRRYHCQQNPGSRLLIGPWFHAGQFNASPSAPSKKPGIDHGAELRRFFDLHLRGIDDGIGVEKAVRYYTMGEGADYWQAAATWPPAGSVARRLHLGAAGTLREAVGVAGSDRYAVDAEVGSGRGARWGLVIINKEKRGYPDRAEIDRRLLTYDTAPLDRALEVTGHPLVTLHLSANGPDGALFVYLEDVTPKGEVIYVTEGVLRLGHRDLASSPCPADPVPYRSFERGSFQPMVPGRVEPVVVDLLPTSYVFARGHRLRIAIAGADADHFPSATVDGLVYQVHRGAATPSHVELPTRAPGGA